MRLSFQVPGKVATLLADEGNTVKKGQKVASLAKEELQNIRDQAQGSFKEAELNWLLRPRPGWNHGAPRWDWLRSG